MNSNFKTQKTNMNSFSNIEKKLYAMSTKNGFGEKLSEAIAYSFTNFILDYLTTEGVAQYLVKNGADRKMAADMAKLFAEVRGQANAIHSPKPNSNLNNPDVIASNF